MRRPLCLICLLFVLLVMACMPFFLPHLTQKSLPENQTYFDFTGQISEMETANDKSVLYLKNKKLGLSVLCYMSGDISGLKIGNTVRVSGKVRYFEPAANDGQFDAKLYYTVLHIDFAMSGCEWTLTDNSQRFFLHVLYQIKTRIGRSLDDGLSENDAGVLKAMLLGDKKSMTPSVKGLYQRNGIAHILAVSGLHITIWGMGLCRLLKKVCIPLSVANFMAFLFVVIYGMMTGSQASAVRSIIMFSLFLLAPVVRRTYDMMTAMALSAASLLFLNPFYIYHSGFLLSFAAVAGIVFLLPYLSKLFCDDSLIRRMTAEEPSRKNRIKKKVKQFLVSSLSVSLSVTLATLPIQIYFFYTVPVYSVFLNLLITPLVGTLMIFGMCGAVIGCFFESVPYVNRILLYPCHLILGFYEKVCTLFDKLSLAHPVLAKPAVWRIVLYYVLLAGIIMLANRCAKRRGNIRQENIDHKKINYKKIGKGSFKRGKICKKGYLIITGLLMLNIILICLNPRCCNRITMLDVGQGDCFVIEEKGGKTILIDGGSSSVNEVGKYRIIPFLKSHGIAKLDYVFLSHSDSDHTNGVSEIVQSTESDRIRIDCLVITDSEKESDGYKKLLSACSENGVKTACIAEGDYLNCGELSFLCLYPEKKYTDVDTSGEGGKTDGDDSNDCSMVLLLECGNFKMMFTGDLSSERESDIRMTDKKGEPVGRVDILKTAHHGSKYSTSDELLREISPTAAFISAGRGNSYGHPHPETLDRLEKEGCRIFRTDESGQITVRIKEEKVVIEKRKGGN